MCIQTLLKHKWTVLLNHLYITYTLVRLGPTLHLTHLIKKENILSGDSPNFIQCWYDLFARGFGVYKIQNKLLK